MRSRDGVLEHGGVGKDALDQSLKSSFRMSAQPVKSHDEDSFNFNKLDKELYAAVDADKKYWTENDAKFRAVHQKVETYEEFRDIVKASHLKPLEKGDNLNSVVFDQPWNSHAIKMKNAASTTTSISPLKESDNLPKNGQEFVKEWRRHHKTHESQYSYLLEIGGSRLTEIFKTEISFGLLGDLLTALCRAFDASDASAIITVLEALCSANRFSLSVQFLSSAERQVCVDLFGKLRTAGESQTEDDRASYLDRLKQLEIKYELKS